MGVTDSTAEVASYAEEVARLLWPAPWDAPFVTRSRHRAGEGHRDAYLFPSRRRPRLLVPADVPASAVMLRRSGHGRSTLGGPVRGLLERSVRSSAFSLVRWPMLRVPGADPGADSIERYLAEHLDTPVRVGVLLGTRRVNQKPVLQVFAEDGRLLGYAKVGHNDLTAALVLREATSLRAVTAEPTRWFRAPRVLHHGRWSGLEVLVVTPLVAGRGEEGPVPPRARVNAMLELAGLTSRPCAPLATTGFWARLRASVRDLAHQPDGARLDRVLASLERDHGSDAVRIGGWHGDWSRWNTNVRDGVVQVWDWERYDAEVPHGFDGLHLVAHAIRSGRGDLAEQEGTFLRAVPRALIELGVGEREHALTLRLYLATITDRYLHAMEHADTAALRRRTGWTLSLLERLAGPPLDTQPTPLTRGLLP